MSLSVISIPPTAIAPPAGLVVGLHGWGANAEDLASLAPLLNLPNYQFLFPEAPFAHPYSSQGKMWYSLPQTPAEAERGREELSISQELLANWLTNLPQSTGIPLERVILLGFSQGGAMILELGLKLPSAGLVVLSGYLHPEIKASGGNLPPILLVHGRQDNVVPIASARSANMTLATMSAAVDYHEFDMGHEIRPQVLPLIADFISLRLENTDSL